MLPPVPSDVPLPREPGLSHSQHSVDGSGCEGVCAWFVVQDRVGDYYVAVIKRYCL